MNALPLFRLDLAFTKRALLIILSAFSFPSFSQEISLALNNQDAFDHHDEQVVILRKSLKSLEPQFKKGLLPLLYIDGKPLASQVDDMDEDGQWDELAFVVNVPAQRHLSIVLKTVNKDEVPHFISRAHAFLGKSPDRNGKFVQVKDEVLPKDHIPQSEPPLYQMEGPIWENDKGAFRLYFDIRNGKDIFGKSTSKIMMDTIGLPGGNYHAQTAWGMDVLKVGTSLGSGAVAFLIKNADGKENLYRLGDKIDQTRYKVISYGPVRAIAKLIYTGVNMGDVKFNAEDEITIWAGSPGFQSKISISSIQRPVKLVTGIVNLHNTKPEIKKTTNQYVLLASHDQQSENKDYLGMALLIPKKSFLGFDKAPDKDASITHTFETIQAISPSQPATYEFLTAWEGRNKAYANKEYFLKEMEQYARQKYNPIKITIK